VNFCRNFSERLTWLHMDRFEGGGVAAETQILSRFLLMTPSLLYFFRFLLRLPVNLLYDHQPLLHLDNAKFLNNRIMWLAMFMHTDSCGEALALKQLPFSSWKENLTKAITTHSTKPARSVCPLPGEAKITICPMSRLNFQTNFPPPKPGGANC